MSFMQDDLSIPYQPVASEETEEDREKYEEESDTENQPNEVKEKASALKFGKDEKGNDTSPQPLLEEITDDEGVPNELMLFIISGCLTGISLAKVPVLMNYTGWFGIIAILLIPLILGYSAYLLCLNYSTVFGNTNDSNIADHYVKIVGSILGKRHLMAFKFIFMLYLILTLSIFLSEMGHIVSRIAPPLFKDISVENNMRMCILIIGAGSLPFPLLRTKRRYWVFAILSGLSGIAAALTMTLALGMVKEKHLYNNTTIEHLNYSDTPYIPIFNLALEISSKIAIGINLFSLHQVFPTLLSDMKEPAKGKTIVAAGYSFPTVAVVAVSLMAYLTYSNNIPTDLMIGLISSGQYQSEMSFFKAIVFVLQIIIGVNLGNVYLLNMNTLNLYFEGELKVSKEWQRFLLRLGSTLIITGLALLTPTNILKFYYINGILSCLVAAYYPIICYLQSMERPRISYYLFNGFILFLMFVISIMALTNIIKFLIVHFSG